MSTESSSGTFAVRLREVLQGRGMTAAKLADAARVQRSTVTRILRGERQATRATVNLFAIALGSTLTDLIAGTDLHHFAAHGPQPSDVDAAVLAARNQRERAERAEARAAALALEVTSLRRTLDRIRSALVEDEA